MRVFKHSASIWHDGKQKRDRPLLVIAGVHIYLSVCFSTKEHLLKLLEECHACGVCYEDFYTV